MAAKTKQLSVNLSEKDAQLLADLAEDYGVDKSTLIRLALRWIDQMRPTIGPRSRAVRGDDNF